MMSLTDLPLSFWGYALETAAFTLNRAPSKSIEMNRDEDINTIVTPTAPAAIHTGPITKLTHAN